MVDEEAKMMDECIEISIGLFDKNKIWPSPDNITDMSLTLFKAKNWKGTFKK